TSIFLTENAPPVEFAVINIDPIDINLSAYQGWTYTITGHFTGTFDTTGEAAEGQLAATVQANEIGQTRRVVLEVEGAAFLLDAALLKLEGVRWSNDYYVVDVNGRCTQDQQSGTAIADLGATQLIGGVSYAVPTGHRKDISDSPAWQYTFAPENVRLPALHRTADSTVILGADLWFSPDHNAVLVYEVSATVEHVYLLWADQESGNMVSGTLYLRYELDLHQLDVPPNISVPNGC
ncbi:MAG: hypothetical protein JXA10_02690, partial [Anaerolineae bacterium]|nr:hypothetical protein [Anaerolineae bacterium]